MDPLYADTEGGDELDLNHWIEVLKRRRRLVAVVAGAVVAVSIVLYAITPKVYRATTVIQIERHTNSPLKVEDVLGTDSYWDAETFYPTQYKLLQSRGLAERVVRELRLAEDSAFNPGSNTLLTAGKGTTSTADDDAAMVAGLAGRVLGGLSISPVRDTRLVDISYVSTSPKLAAKIANGVAQAYIDWGIEMRGETAGRATSFLSSQIAALKKEIENNEAKLQAYSRRTDIVALDPTSNVILQRLEALNKDYTAAMSDRINKEAHYQELLNSPPEAVAENISGGIVTQLQGDLLKLEREYASKLSTYKPEWPAMQDLKAEIDKGRQNLQSVVNETVTKARETAKAEYQTALRREQSLAAELTKQKSDAMQLNSAAVEYNNLKVEVETRRSLMDQLLRKQSETEMASSMQGSRETNVVVVDRALRPGGPFRPSLRRNLSMGLALGLALGLGAAVLVEFLDRTLKSEADVERIIGLPALATIPDISAGSSHHGYYYGRYGYHKKRERKPRPSRRTPGEEPHIELICVRHPRLAVSEAYRTLRTAMLLSTADKLQTILITSATVGEGKTATAGNLAVVLSQLDKTVLLIDGDLRKPRQHEVFRVSNRTGIVNCLAGQTRLEEAVVRVGSSALSLLPAGPTPPNPAELLASERMRELMAAVEERYDYIVLDSPPVLPVTDASILSQLADGVVFCVSAGGVVREDVVAARDRLAMVDAHMLGVLLNRFRPFTGRYSKGYYARYQSYLDQTSGDRSAPGAKAG